MVKRSGSSEWVRCPLAGPGLVATRVGGENTGFAIFVRSVFFFRSFVCVSWIVLLVDGVKSGGARLLNVGFFFYGLFTHPRLGGNYLKLESSLFFAVK